MNNIAPEEVELSVAPTLDLDWADAECLYLFSLTPMSGPYPESRLEA